MTAKILKSTSRGQITLPKQWRDHFATDHYRVVAHPDKLVIIPFHVEAGEEVVFDADRDNDGNGVSPDAMIKLLKRIRRHG